MTSAPTIAVCLPVRNGAATIERLIASIREHVDELCFFLAGASTDGTPEILSRLAAEPGAVVKVEQGVWTNDYAAARNASFAMAETDWIAWADDDEVFVGAENLRGFLATTTADLLDVRRVDLLAPDLPFAVFFARVVRRSVGPWWYPRIHVRLTVPKWASVDCVPPPVMEIIHNPLPQEGRHDHIPLVEAELARTDDPELRMYVGRHLWDTDMAAAAREFERIIDGDSATLAQKARAATRLSMARYRLEDVAGARAAQKLHEELSEAWKRECPPYIRRRDLLDESFPITPSHPVWQYAGQTLFPEKPVRERMTETLHNARRNGLPEETWAEAMLELGMTPEDIAAVRSRELVAA